ncbi:MAG TPA: malto-oligosyltrehalose synthase [Acidimicrobiales bacterium]|nr:malto-oligosyltrehalose synthase [Acidimicrobiales bacterium]
MAAEPAAGEPAEPGPWATYRVQLSPTFTFDDAAAIAGYLADLGITHLYASPVLQAAPGSTHGYDVVDHHRVNVELGGEAGHARMCDALGAAGLGQVLDVVPNHMAIGGPENAWWWDVLENGPASVYAAYFDVDWDPPEFKLRHTVLLPILGDHYGRVLEAGELNLRREGGSFTVHYHDHVVPVAPRTIDRLLVAAAEDCGSAELESIGAAFGRLPPATATDRDSVRERHRDKEVLRARLSALCEEEPERAASIDRRVEAINADCDALDALLDRQNYRLAFWRTAGRELDYRRFFDINTLVGVRVEDPQVFDDTHTLLLEWLDKGVIDGLRIDHPDGLLDPEGYLDRLHDATGGKWTVVEKILEPGEQLPESWPVAGTTGYDFLSRVGGLFVDPAGRDALLATYTGITGRPADFDEAVLANKHLVLRDVLAADLNRLTALFVQVCERHRRYRDYTRHELHEALREVLACFPVYRTYVRPADGTVRDADVARVEHAVSLAVARRPDIDGELFTFLADLLLLRRRGEAAAPGLPAPVGEVEAELVARFQQVTGPVMAKGVEDTTFYDYVPLVSLNEVGDSPGHWGTTVDEFHRSCAEAARTWPRSMLATSTHDTKRSEDVRARLHLLSEMPDRWTEAVERWRAMNVRHRAGPDLPDSNIEYLLYQTLVGAWPLPLDRAAAYMEKAAKEAKSQTSWIDPDLDYDAALRAFVDGVMGDEAFQADLAVFVAPLVAPGRVSSLAQALVKLTAPGVPDTYQGTELWDLSLVDPDNRRPVDYATRRRLLAELAGMDARSVWARADEGLPKLHVVREALHLRQRVPEAFGATADYVPVAAGGQKAAHVVAYCRGGLAVTVVPRLVLGLGRDWLDTVVDLPPGRWGNVLTGDDIAGGSAAVADLLASFPVALLERSPDA